MKIVLFAINGSFSHTNLAIRCLRDPLEGAGFEVVLIEHTLRDRTAHILEHLHRENPCPNAQRLVAKEQNCHGRSRGFLWA